MARRGRCTLISVKRLGWLTRSDKTGRRAIVPVVFGLAVLGFAGFLAPDVVSEYDDRAILHSRGQEVTATVIEVLERSRTDLALYVRSRLSDGRTVDVYLAESDQLGAEPGTSIRVTVDPTDLGRNMPADLLAREDPFVVAMIKYIGPVVLFAVGWFVFAAVIARRASRRPSTQQPD